MFFFVVFLPLGFAGILAHYCGVLAGNDGEEDVVIRDIEC